MTRKTYRTAQGKTVDLGALMLNNENTRAVGNMKVNARGDLVDGWNRPIDRRTQQVQKQYDRQVTNVRDEPVPRATAAKPSTKEDTGVKKIKNAKPEPVTEAAADGNAPQGLAAAIAKARQIRQETVKKPNNTVKKI